jgi:hypothetical protein
MGGLKGHVVTIVIGVLDFDSAVLLKWRATV